jgi:hypothetical protein
MSTRKAIAVAAAAVAAAGMAVPAQAAKPVASSPPKITGDVMFVFTPTAGRCSSTTSLMLDKAVTKGQAVNVRWTLHSQYDLPPAITTVPSGSTGWSFTMGHCGTDGAVYTGLQVELFLGRAKTPYDSRSLTFTYQCLSEG